MSTLTFVVLDKKDKKIKPELKLSLKTIGYFSVNEKQTYCVDDRQLKYNYYNLSSTNKVLDVNFNLNFVPEKVVKKITTQTNWDRLTNMFLWLSLNSSRLCIKNEVPFFCFRGTLTKIMTSPFLQKDDWTICARLCSGLIYLNQFDTDNDIRNKQSAREFQLKCETWGFRFEQYMVTSDPKTKPNPNEILNENCEFCCVFDGKMGDHRIIYGAEMDGACSEETLNLHDDTEYLSKIKFVELKTNGSNYRQQSNMRRFKMLKWWCQSYLSGVESIICGFRDDSGKVKSLKYFKVNDLPKMCGDYWSSNVCINFCVRFLDFVKSIVLSESGNDGDVWKFDLIPQNKVCVTKVSDDSSIYKSGFRTININNS